MDRASGAGSGLEVTDLDPGFRGLDPGARYLPIEDFGLIGDGETVALVGRDGSVAWLCVPRLDSPPLFCSILDHDRGGSFRVAPDPLVASRQRYVPGTGVLVTEMQTSGGMVRVTDCLTLRSGADLAEDTPSARGEMLRCVEVLEGDVEVTVEVEPRGGADFEPTDEGLSILPKRRPELTLQLQTSVPLARTKERLQLRAGDHFDLVMRWGGVQRRRHMRELHGVLDGTMEAWRRWADCIRYEGPHQSAVHRSALTLKMLDYLGSGAIVAAATSSLPEQIGGTRNWDYRYAWVRDAAFSVYAFRRVGLDREAWDFLGWVLDAVDRAGTAQVLYTVDGHRPAIETVDEELEGYRASAPVRWGNGAAAQRQHDAYGEIIDAAYQWAARGGKLDRVWPRLHGLIEEARERWKQPDHGIWEVRTTGRVFTYSAAMCHVALDRGARLVDRFGFEGDAEAWRAEATKIRDAILNESWDEERQSLTENLGVGGLDASLLALPLRRVIPAQHPRMVATVEAVTRRLGAGEGLLYRYLPEESPDGLPGHEGAFLLCSFWLVDNLVYQGRLAEANELFDSLCRRASPLGLLPEEIDPGSGAFLGNFPQAFSHVGLISSGINLARAEKEKR